jgi:hypothetical protein
LKLKCGSTTGWWCLLNFSHQDQYSGSFAATMDSSATGGPGAEASPPVLNPAAKKPPNLSAALQVEQQLMRLPFEGLKKQVRATSRIVEKEVNAVVAGVADASSKDLTHEEAVKQLHSLVSRLQGLKRKVGLSITFRMFCRLCAEDCVKGMHIAESAFSHIKLNVI